MSIRRKPQQSSRVARRPISFESRVRGRVTPEQFTASQAKNEFARMLEGAITRGIVVITKHDAPKAVLLSIEEFDELTRARREVLAPLRAELEEMVRDMQSPTQRKATRSLFEATPEELGRAAVAEARKAARKARG